MGSQHIVELVVFALKEGTTRERFLATVDAVTEWCGTRPGFVSRELSYATAEDKWIDIVRWRSLDDAEAASRAALSSPACTPMFELIDPQSTLMLHGVPATILAG